MVIRRVVLDAFGTIFSPREPVFQQYATVARQFGLKVEEQGVKDRFKQAFKRWAKEYPLYGKHSAPPLEPSVWWSGVIQETFRNAGVAEKVALLLLLRRGSQSHFVSWFLPDFEPVKTRLSDTLVWRFWGRDGYALHSDVHSFLSGLSSLALPETSSPFPPPAIASNTDPAVSKILDSLGVLSSQVRGGIREEEVWTTWDIEEEKSGKPFWEEVLKRLQRTTEGAPLRAEEVLVVGDELVSDYETPRAAGLRSLLLRRSEGEEHANPRYQDEQEGLRRDVEVVKSLEEVVEWIRRENGEE
ncbi:hypothetical protein JCM8547_001525 [Rhodosporidiobolus lusitaniae]